MSISFNQSKSLIKNLPRGISPINGSDSDDKWAVILAGGDGLPRGQSLIPAFARGGRPRQFLRTPGSDFVINKTRRQVSLTFPPEKTMFVVNENHLSYIEDVLDDVPPGNIIVEPQDDGSVFAILYSVLRLRKTNPNAVVTFFPSDFDALDPSGFMAQVEAAQDAVRRQPNLILLGIEPESPDENREWIEPDLSSPMGDNLNVWRVRDFRQSVSPSEARELMKRGGLWNSSVMVGTVSTFLRKIRRAAPEIYESFIAAESKIGTPGERLTVRRIYHGNYADTDFSRDVLAKSADKLMVIPVPAAKVRGIGVNPPVIVASRQAATTALKGMEAASVRV
jgi:mannose-1-phosphate guanylyltransferase